MRTLFLAAFIFVPAAAVQASAQPAEIRPFYEPQMAYVFPSKESALEFMREFRFWSFLKPGTGIRPVDIAAAGYDGWCAMNMPQRGFHDRTSPATGCVLDNKK